LHQPDLHASNFGCDLVVKVDMRTLSALIAAASLLPGIGAGSSKGPFAPVPDKHRNALKRRLDEYVALNRERNWSKLYDLVSDTGRGGVNRHDFVAMVDADHDRFYANSHDLLKFQPNRTLPEADGYDIYGCGKARREQETDTGIVVIHAVFQRGNWYFTGWAFTQNPPEPCSRLSDPKWQAEEHIQWNQPMEEIRPQPAQGSKHEEPDASEH
jgi:hypothetical protein